MSEQAGGERSVANSSQRASVKVSFWDPTSPNAYQTKLSSRIPPGLRQVSEGKIIQIRFSDLSPQCARPKATMFDQNVVTRPDDQYPKSRAMGCNPKSPASEFGVSIRWPKVSGDP
jgi:hypothetical protein